MLAHRRVRRGAKPASTTSASSWWAFCLAVVLFAGGLLLTHTQLESHQLRVTSEASYLHPAVRSNPGRALPSADEAGAAGAASATGERWVGRARGAAVAPREVGASWGAPVLLVK